MIFGEESPMEFHPGDQFVWPFQIPCSWGPNGGFPSVNDAYSVEITAIHGLSVADDFVLESRQVAPGIYTVFGMIPSDWRIGEHIGIYATIKDRNYPQNYPVVVTVARFFLGYSM